MLIVMKKIVYDLDKVITMMLSNYYGYQVVI